MPAKKIVAEKQIDNSVDMWSEPDQLKLKKMLMFELVKNIILSNVSITDDRIYDKALSLTEKILKTEK